MDDIELDNERHRREEHERRAKRQKNRESKSKSGQLSEKERKRREHAQRILGAQKKKPISSSATPSQAGGGAASSIFQSLFHERAEGFFIDLRFRNAPPRPPVGPTFVGLGLEGELTNKWTKYKARNAVENQYTWKLHPSRDLGVPLAVSAMDYEGCYTDRVKKVQEKGEDFGADGLRNSEHEHPHVIPVLHVEDDALINWRGSIGDTAAEQLQQKQDRVRAAARLAISQGYGTMPCKMSYNAPSSVAAGGSNASVSAFRLKKHHLKSRILDEKTPNFMKKTTYLTNDATSVHRFTSLAQTQVKRAKDVDQALAETKTKYSEMDMIAKGFKDANSSDILSSGTVESVGENRRIHPSKKETYPIWDLPLLPDVPMWGHTYTHVVLDNPPKNLSSMKITPLDESLSACLHSFEAKELDKAIVADVAKRTQNSRMLCTVWVPQSDDISVVSSKLTVGKSLEREMYLALQQYELDVVPLKDHSTPPVHYVWIVDPSKEYVGYHCVGSRVQLSTGRPVVVCDRPQHVNAEGITTSKSFICHRLMEGEEEKDLEIKMADVDVDLAEKHGLIDMSVSGQEDSNDEGGWVQKSPKPDSDGDGIEVDAF